MKYVSLLLAAALTTPALAAPSPAPPPVLGDFSCLVRTMYIAGAAEETANKATDAASRENAMNVSTEAYEAASYFIGRLTTTKGTAVTKTRFDAEVASLAKLGDSALSGQIAQCTTRAKTERAAFITPFAGK